MQSVYSMVIIIVIIAYPLGGSSSVIVPIELEFRVVGFYSTESTWQSQKGIST